MTIDMDSLHKDLLEHFGTMTVLAHSPTSPITHGLVTGALGDIDALFQMGNYQALVDLALGEGFDLTQYAII